MNLMIFALRLFTAMVLIVAVALGSGLESTGRRSTSSPT
jgi:hypothetical protein